MNERSVKDVSARNVRLRVVSHGDEGTPVLLLHGFLMNHHVWDDILGGLASPLRAVTPDLPGFGESEKPPPARFDYSVEAFAECVTDLIAALHLGRVHLVGHGLGGSIALTLAAQHPEFVDRLVLVDPFVYSRRPSPRVLHWPVLGPLVFKQLYGRTLFRAYFRDQIFSPGFDAPVAQVDAFYGMFNAPAARESALATMRAVADTRSTVARLSRVKAPTLVIWGRHDALSPLPFGQRLAREIGATRFAVMESGHAPHLEQPAAFVANVRAFLGAAKG